MLTWERRLYLFDLAQDIREEWTEEARKGGSDIEIRDKMIERYSSCLEDEEDKPVFWFSFADTAWNLGRLDPETKESVLKMLDQHWIIPNSEMICEGLRQKLLSEQPKRKQFRKRRLYRTPWKDGDVYAWRIEGDFARKNGVEGRYFLLYKIGELNVYPGHIEAVVGIKVTDGPDLPQSREELDRMAYLSFAGIKYENRLWWLLGNATREQQIAENERVRKIADQDGVLRIYRASVAPIKKDVESQLIYIGNYPGLEMPRNEFLPRVSAEYVEIRRYMFDEYLIEALLRGKFDR